MSGVGLLTGGWGPAFSGAAAGSLGPSDVVFYFTMTDQSTGLLAAGLTISASELQVSVNGGSFANRLGAQPTSVGSGLYYYVLDAAEAQQGTVAFKINKTGYLDANGNAIISTIRVDTSVTAAQSALNNAITNAISAIATNIASAQTAINAHTDSQLATERTTINAHTDSQLATERTTIVNAIDAVPTAAEIDTQLSATHGAGSWGTAGLDVTAIVNAIFGKLMEGSVTFGDAIRGLLSLTGGPVTDFKTNTLTFKSLDGSKVRFTITVSKNGRLSVVIGDLT